MKTKLAAIILLGSALSSTAVFAETAPEWNFLQGSVESLSIDNANGFDPLGVGITASYLLTDNIFVDTKYSRLSDDPADVDVDVTMFYINLGYRYGMSDITDLYGSIGFANVNVEASSNGNSAEDDDDGLQIKIGARSRLTDQFEIDTHIVRQQIGDKNTQLGFSGHYYINEQLALGVGVLGDSDGKQYSFSARYAF
jgi:opacity protein-like surface antigen